MSVRMYLADGRSDLGFGSQAQVRITPGKAYSSQKGMGQSDPFDGYVEAHRWVGSGTLDSQSLQYQNRVSRVVTKESAEGKKRLSRRKGFSGDFDDHDEDEEIQRELEAILVLKAAGFLAFVKSWETKLMADLDRKEAGLDEEEKDRLALAVKDKELQLRENMILAKEHKMLKQQLEYLQQQASIQQEGPVFFLLHHLLHHHHHILLLHESVVS
jgi:hypothetical protein